MKVLLVDIDSKIPNLALMKISAYYKSKGEEVGFNVRDPNYVFISCIFPKNQEQALGVQKLYPKTPFFIIGGTGVNYLKLNDEMEFIKPDYDLYFSAYSQGYTTRGCIRNCPWCVVRKKEGDFKRHQHIKEFHDDIFGTVMIMDNNWLADKEWFFENTDFILENNLKVIEHGMDVRLLDTEIAERLSELSFFKPMKFAFDQPQDERPVREGIELLKSVGIDCKHKVQFYVLVGYNTTHDEDLYRLNLLKKLGVSAFVMQYKKTKDTRKLARWANRKHFFFSCDYENFQPNLRLKNTTGGI